MLASKYRHTLFYGDSFQCPSQILNSFFFLFKQIADLWQVYWCHFPNSFCSLLTSVQDFELVHDDYVGDGDL